MLTAIIVTLVITAGLRYGLRPNRRGQFILHRPYNNRYNDASGARQDALLE